MDTSRVQKIDSPNGQSIGKSIISRNQKEAKDWRNNKKNDSCSLVVLLLLLFWSLCSVQATMTETRL